VPIFAAGTSALAQPMSAGSVVLTLLGGEAAQVLTNTITRARRLANDSDRCRQLTNARTRLRGF
jgi:hypothetical protein